jgi:hypothetical protein
MLVTKLIKKALRRSIEDQRAIKIIQCEKKKDSTGPTVCILIYREFERVNPWSRQVVKNISYVVSSIPIRISVCVQLRCILRIGNKSEAFEILDTLDSQSNHK